MPSGFVLINCELGTEEHTINELKSFDVVKEADQIFGVYDIIAKLVATSNEELKDTITNKIHNLKNVKSNLTLLTIEGQG